MKREPTDSPLPKRLGCLILSDQPSEYLARLTERMSAQDARATFCSTPEHVMLGLARGGLNVVMIDQLRFPDPTQLVNAIKTYHGQTKIWLITYDEQTGKRRLVKHWPVAAKAEQVKVEAKIEVGDLSGAGQPLVTRDEIRMLLGDRA